MLLTPDFIIVTDPTDFLCSKGRKSFIIVNKIPNIRNELINIKI